MYGYVWEGERAGVTRQRIGGVWFAVATVPSSGRLLAGYRRGRVLRKLRRQGIRTCVLPSALTTEAARWGLREMPVQELRLALLPQLLDMRGDLRRATAVLRADCADAAVYRAAAVLASRVRYVTLQVGAGGEALAEALRRRFGLCAGSVEGAALTVSFGGAPEHGAVICLGEDCGRYQRLTYEMPEGLLDPWPVSEQLLAALYQAGEIKKEEIRVKTIAPNA